MRRSIGSFANSTVEWFVLSIFWIFLWDMATTGSVRSFYNVQMMILIVWYKDIHKTTVWMEGGFGGHDHWIYDKIFQNCFLLNGCNK